MKKARLEKKKKNLSLPYRCTPIFYYIAVGENFFVLTLEASLQYLSSPVHSRFSIPGN
jgi:hypothetical protein